jgi:hypothetical protein
LVRKGGWNAMTTEILKPVRRPRRVALPGWNLWKTANLWASCEALTNY